MEFVNLHFGRHSIMGGVARRSVPILRSVATRATSVLPDRTDFSPLDGKHVLVVLDEDNVRISMQEHGRSLSFDLLLQKLSAVAGKISPWAVLTANVGDTRREDNLIRRGWHALSMPRETVMTVKGPCTKSNADLDIAFLFGSLVLKNRFDAAVIGSGDGDLCVSIARGIRRLRAVREIHTISVPGSTSQRILATNNALFDDNVLLGRDVTRPEGSRDRMSPPALFA